MIVLHAVGDVAPDRPDPGECFSQSRDTLRRCDIGFCQLECNLTNRGTRMPQARHTHRGPEGTARAMRDAGINVVSFAGNHCMDWGPEGLADTMDRLQGAGISVVGVGTNIGEARRPAIIEKNGVRTAFLAYSSILPHGYWAELQRPGCAPLRAHTLYEQIEPDQPGTAPRVHTWALQEDLDAMVADIRRVRSGVHAVVVSVHWGLHFVPAELADYQRQLGCAAIDAGADLILGHHAHILKGIEFYRGRAIFYSLSNFAIDLRMTPEHAASKSFREIQSLSPAWVPDFDSLYNFPPDSRMTMIVSAQLGRDGVRDLAFYPAWINDRAQAEVLEPGDPRFGEIVEYVQWCCKSQDLDTRIEVDGGTVRVSDATTKPDVRSARL